MLRPGLDFIDAHFLQLWLLCFGWVVVVFPFRYFRHRSAGRLFRDPPSGDVIYFEGFASGRSMKSWFTRMGGASNCLRVVVTHERLFVRPVFPFLIMGPDFDLVHSVPLKQIESALRKDTAFRKCLRIKFRLAGGESREIEIVSKQPDRFEGVILARIAQSR